MTGSYGQGNRRGQDLGSWSGKQVTPEELIRRSDVGRENKKLSIAEIIILGVKSNRVLA